MTVRKNSVDETQTTLNAFLEWTEVNGMSCNTSKYKELCMAKKGVAPNFSLLCGIEQVFVYFKITKKRWIHVRR